MQPGSEEWNALMKFDGRLFDYSKVFGSRETTLEEFEELQIGQRFLHAPHQVKPSSPRRQPLLDT
jgi:hypothetical protein